MALAEQDPNIIRRNSKSSAYSASIKDSPSYSSRPTSPPDAIQGMLKTTTETGDLGSFSVAPSRFPRLPHALARRPKQGNLGASSSRASSHYSRAGSIRSAKSQRSAHDAASDTGTPYAHRRFAASQDLPFAASGSPIYIPPDNGRSMTMSTTGLLDHADRADRAYSLTQETTYRQRHVADNRSITSMRSQGWNGRPRSPYVQPGRFNVGYRPSSPAWSDNAGTTYSRRPHQNRPPVGPRAFSATPHQMRFQPDNANSPQLAPHPSGHRMPLRQQRTFDDLPRPSPPHVGGLMHDGSNYWQGRGSPPPSEYYDAYRHHQQPPYSRSSDQVPIMPHASAQFPPPLQPMARFTHHDSSLPQQQACRPRTPNVTPYAGFVQRVKNVLEERISTDEGQSTTGSLRRPKAPMSLDSNHHGDLIVVNETPRNDQECATQTGGDDEESSQNGGTKEADSKPDEQPAEAAPDSPSVKRLTRDLIKAGIDGMSDVAEMSDVGGAAEASPDTPLAYEPRGSLQKVQEWSNPSTSEIPGAYPEGQTDSDATTGDDDKPEIESTMAEQTGSNQNNSLTFNVRLSGSNPATSHAPSGTDQPLCGSETVDSRDYQVQEDTTRPFSMPQQTLALERRSPRSNAVRSLPPLSNRRQSLASVHYGIAQENENAIRLSTIRPKHVSSLPFQSESDGHIMDLEGTEDETSANDVLSSTLPREPTSEDSGFEHSTPLLPPTEVFSQTITVSPPTTIVPPVPNRSSGRFSTSMEGVRAVPSASRSGSLSLDQRASAFKSFHSPLPDLTEDSQEDASTTNLRMLGMRAPMFRSRHVRDFRPPSKMALEAVQEPRLPHNYMNMSFAETRNIPSFNFSRVDLTTKLNKALGYRLSRSFEDFTQGSLQSGDVSNEERPMSSSIARERYRSFFVFDESSEEGESTCEPVIDTTKAATKSLAIDQHILNEIDRLSIPSVKHLTSRLSELLPNIKQSQTEGDLDKVDDALKQTLQDLRAIGAAEQQSSSEPLKTLEAARSSSIPPTRGGTVASHVSGRGGIKMRDRPFHLMKDLPPLPADVAEEDSTELEEQSSGDGSLETAPEESHARGSGDSARHDESEMEGTAVNNTVSTILNDLHKKKAEADATATPNKPANGSQDARQEATPRPWNNQENYPWSNKTPPIKLRSNAESQDQCPAQDGKDPPVPAAAACQELGMQEALHVVRSMSPGFNKRGLVPVVNDEKSTPQSGKKGLFKSLTQIVGLKSKSEDVASPSLDPHYLHPEEDQSQALSQTSSRRVDHGDRYPTTSLIAPDGMQVDGVAQADDGNRSFFSNDTSISDRASRGGLRKRLTKFRASRSHGNVVDSYMGSPNDSRGEVHRSSGRPVESEPAVHVPETLTFQQQSYDPAPPGMSKTEFRAKRLVEKLRYMLFKSGERLKHLTQPKKRSRFWYETSASENFDHPR